MESHQKSLIQEIEEWLRGVQFKDWNFRATTATHDYEIRVIIGRAVLDAADIKHEEVQQSYGFTIRPEMKINEAMFLDILMENIEKMLCHEAREWFTYEGKVRFYPHDRKENGTESVGSKAFPKSFKKAAFATHEGIVEREVRFDDERALLPVKL